MRNGGAEVEPFNPDRPMVMIITVPMEVSPYQARALARKAWERLGNDAVVSVRDGSGKTMGRASVLGVE
jgi:hypothetical protein